MLKYAPYSYSRMSTYETCARKFKYKYIDGAKKSTMDMTPLLKGGAVHHILEHYPTRSTHKLAPKYQHIVNNFIQSTLGQTLIFRESTREFDLGLDINLEPCDYNDKEALFRGSVDYVYLDNGILHLVDWKTGKLKEERWQSYDQLMFYALYFFIVYPHINQIKIQYVYVEHLNQKNELMMDRKYLNNYKEKLLKLITSIETDEEFNKTKKNVKLCDWCEFKLHCEDDN